MKTNEEKTDVIFRKEKSGVVLAVFPYDIADYNMNCTCYAHVGQHSGMDWGYLGKTKPAKENDYIDLYGELESIGYNLNVIQKRSVRKYLQACEKLR